MEFEVQRAARNDKVPPHNLEAEMTVLGGILLENRSLDSVFEIGLQVEDFYKEANQKIFKIILELSQKSQPADAITVKNSLASAGLLERIGGTSYIAQLVSTDFVSSNIAAYARIIREKSVERKIIQACTEQASKAYEGVEDHSTYREETEKKILEATADRKLNSFSSLADSMLQVFSDLQSVASRNTDVVGVPSGFKDLDKETMGWHPGQLIIIAARPGMGKTSFMLNTALNASLQGANSVAFFSLEMTKVELTSRLLAMESKVDFNRLKNASRLQEQDWRNLQRAAGSLQEVQFFMDDSSALNILELKSRCRRIQSQFGLNLVVVDYLQLMRGLGMRSSSAGNREQEIAEISRGLKGLAKELSVPVIAASQLSRDIERREKKKPQLSDLRESGAIEQDADLVLFIHRDKENPELQNEAELIIGKHRSGNTGEIKLAWIGQYTTFKDYAYGVVPGTGASVDFF